MAEMNQCMLVVTINVDGLNSPIKRNTGRVNQEIRSINTLYARNTFNLKENP
mgnify:CR=1